MGGVKLWPHLSAHSGLHWAPGSRGREDTVTGTQLHTEARMSPATQAPVPVGAHWLQPLPSAEAQSSQHPFLSFVPTGAHSAADGSCLSCSTRHPTLGLLGTPFPASMPLHPHPELEPWPPQPMPTCLSARALLDAAAAAPAFTHSTAAFLPCHVPGQDIVTGVWGGRVKVALSPPAAHRTLPRGAGSSRWGRGWGPGWKTGAGRCVGL